MAARPDRPTGLGSAHATDAFMSLGEGMASGQPSQQHARNITSLLLNSHPPVHVRPERQPLHLGCCPRRDGCQNQPAAAPKQSTCKPQAQPTPLMAVPAPLTLSAPPALAHLGAALGRDACKLHGPHELVSAEATRARGLEV